MMDKQPKQHMISNLCTPEEVNVCSLCVCVHVCVGGGGGGGG